MWVCTTDKVQSGDLSCCNPQILTPGLNLLTSIGEWEIMLLFGDLQTVNAESGSVEWGGSVHMAKAHEIGTSSIKKCLLLCISTRFS